MDSTFSEVLELYAKWLEEEALKPKKVIEEVVEEEVEPVIEDVTEEKEGEDKPAEEKKADE